VFLGPHVEIGEVKGEIGDLACFVWTTHMPMLGSKETLLCRG
jgi:hypothetical protein